MPQADLGEVLQNTVYSITSNCCYRNFISTVFGHRRRRSDPHGSDINKSKETTTKVNVAQADAPQTGTSGPPTIPDQEREKYDQKLEQELEGAAGPGEVGSSPTGCYGPCPSPSPSASPKLKDPNVTSDKLLEK